MNEFDQKIKEVYEKLLESQEELGDQFYRVLYDNLWNLYDTGPLEFFHEGIKYKAQREEDEDLGGIVYAIYRHVPYGSWIFWSMSGKCSSYEEAKNIFLDKQENG